MNRSRTAVTAFVLFDFAIAIDPCLAQEPPAPPKAAIQTPAPPVAFSMLAGRWVRREGGYVINIKAIDAGGKLDASYANPYQWPFHAAEVTRDGEKLKLFFELRAGGYNGSTYTLTYDTANDQLKGEFYQAVAKQKFDVIFLRAK